MAGSVPAQKSRNPIPAPGVAQAGLQPSGQQRMTTMRAARFFAVAVVGAIWALPGAA